MKFTRVDKDEIKIEKTDVNIEVLSKTELERKRDAYVLRLEELNKLIAETNTMLAELDKPYVEKQMDS